MTSSSGAKMGRSRDQVKKKSSSSLLLSQRTELIGELSQAMANHFNNIMMAVTGYAELELKKPTVQDKRALEQVLANANQATLLIQTLLDLGRERAISPQPIELNAVISDLSGLLKDLLGDRVDLSLALNAKPSTINADRIDIQQCLFALLIVARNEMRGSGRLTIETSLVEINRAFIASDRCEAGEYLLLSIESEPMKTGDEPGFHKKLDTAISPNLSLDGVRAVVSECHGLSRLSSEPGGNSAFKLYFPATEREALGAPELTLPRQPAVARTILVVEDDDAVRVPAAEFLKMEGFKVLQARNGSEALNVVQQSRSALDILIADLFMPKMNGPEVAAKLLEQYPDLKVIYMSGDPGRSGAAGGKMAPDMALRKPFRLNVLRDRIHDLLGE